jgi:hypothetical protein
MDISTFMSPKSKYASELQKKLEEYNDDAITHKLSLIFSSFGSRTNFLLECNVEDIYFYKLVFEDHYKKIDFDDNEFKNIICIILDEKYADIIKKIKK